MNNINKRILNALFDYIDKKAEYDYANTVKDDEGYTSSCVDERKAMESTKEKLIKLCE